MFGVIEPQCPGERVDDGLGHSFRGAALQAGEVLDADTGEGCQLSASKAG